jgi:hypothetical protein
MLIVESATAILNLITGVPEIYVHSVEILTADYGVVGIRLLAAASLIALKLESYKVLLNCNKAKLN